MPLTLQQFLRIVELRTKVVSVSGFLIGTLYGALRSESFDAVTTAVLFAAVLAVDMATTGFNSFFDHFSGVDRRDRNREVDKVLVHEGVPSGIALLVSLTLYLIAAALGIVLALRVGPWIIIVGAASMLVGFLYNGGPLPISRTPLGELFAGGFLGWLLVILSALVQGVALDQATVQVGLPSMLLVASILTVNNTCDMNGDRLAGRTTLSLVLGYRNSTLLIPFLGAVGFVYATVLAWQETLPLIVVPGIMIAGIIAVPQYFKMNRRGYSHTTKGPSMQTISRIFLLFTAGVAIPLMLSHWGISLPVGR